MISNGIDWIWIRQPLPGDKITITDITLTKINGYFVEDLGNGKFIFKEALSGQGFEFIFDKKWINHGWVSEDHRDDLKKWVYYNSPSSKIKRRNSCQKESEKITESKKKRCTKHTHAV